MNVEIGAEAAQFPEKEYINGIAVAVCAIEWTTHKNQHDCRRLSSNFSALVVMASQQITPSLFTFLWSGPVSRRIFCLEKQSSHLTNNL